MSSTDSKTLKFRVSDPNDGITRWVVWNLDIEMGMIYYRARPRRTDSPLTPRGDENPYELTKTDGVTEHMIQWFQNGCSLLPGWGEEK